MELKPLVIVAGIALAGIGATQGMREYRHRTNGPFAIWSMNAGKPFAAMDGDALRMDGRRFICRPLVATFQLCEYVSLGTGTTRVVVDSTLTIAVVQFLPDTETSRLRDEARQLSARWNEVRPAQTWGPDSSRGERSVVHWATADGRWSATMRFGKFPSAPTSITTVDERRLAKLTDADPMAVLHLASQHLLDRPSRVDYAAAVARVFARREHDAPAATARGAALIAPAIALPVCARELSDTVETPDAWSQARLALGATTSELAERAVAVAHPGARLIVAQHTVFVNPDGSAEAVRLTDVVSDGGNRQHAFALEYTRRADAAEHRMTDFEPGNDCRSPSEIVVVTQDAMGRVAGARFVAIDEEALATRITRLSFGAALGGEHWLLVNYSASYATRGWYGSVDWEALVDLESGRVVTRAPIAAGRKDATDRENALVLVASDTAPVGLHLTGLSVGDPLPSFIVLPPGPNGLWSGWMLLDLL